MNPESPPPQISTLAQQEQTESHNEVVAKKSLLSLVGLILAILVPPIGLIVSCIALIQSIKNNLSAKDKAVFGVIWGATFTVPFLVFVFLIFAANQNSAAHAIQPFIAKIQKAGGKKLCDNGDGGHGIDNQVAWYEAYYRLPDGPNVTAMIKTNAAQIGYSLRTDTGLINDLKKGPNQFDTTFNSKNDYLIGENNGKTLTITINRDTSVPLLCGVSNYGKEQPTAKHSTILDITSQF